MTKQTEALRMAIEALEMHVPYYIKDRGCDAIQACKEALADYKDGNCCTEGCIKCDARKVLAETQEPVAYQPTSQEQSVMHQAMIRSSKLVHKAVPPNREWQSLQNDEIYKILNDNIGGSSYAIARAISEALREKNT